VPEPFASASSASSFMISLQYGEWFLRSQLAVLALNQTHRSRKEATKI
jgi:hypothetical protein